MNDQKNLQKGREKAALNETTRDASTLQYLIETGPLLRTSTLTDTFQLVSTLKEVFRNQVPTDWAKRKKILLLSLTCLSLILQNYREIVGNVTDAESLAAAFHELAQHAHFINKHGKGREHGRLVEKILGLQSIMMLDGKNVGNGDDATTSVDPPTLYRQTLGPFRFDFCESLTNHSFSSQKTNLNMRKLFQELSAYSNALPVEFGSSIFVRAEEGRLDVLRALIIGPEDTPYANGCFFLTFSSRTIQTSHRWLGP